MPEQVEILTISEATKRGIARLRDPKWANPNAYVKIDLIDVDGQKCCGPWAHLYDRQTQEVIGEPTPQTFLIMTLKDESGIAYYGPLDIDDREGEICQKKK